MPKARPLAAPDGCGPSLEAAQQRRAAPDPSIISELRRDPGVGDDAGDSRSTADDRGGSPVARCSAGWSGPGMGKRDIQIVDERLRLARRCYVAPLEAETRLVSK